MIDPITVYPIGFKPIDRTEQERETMSYFAQQEYRKTKKKKYALRHPVSINVMLSTYERGDDGIYRKPKKSLPKIGFLKTLKNLFTAH